MAERQCWNKKRRAVVCVMTVQFCLHVDRKKYFMINRGRQYGKTTTLRALTKRYGRETKVCNPLTDFIAHCAKKSLRELFQRLSEVCAAADKAVVLMVDEVDSASNNQVFLDFLAQLRMYYLNREELPTFHSVILAGVYDIKI